MIQGEETVKKISKKALRVVFWILRHNTFTCDSSNVTQSLHNAYQQTNKGNIRAYCAGGCRE